MQVSPPRLAAARRAGEDCPKCTAIAGGCRRRALECDLRQAARLPDARTAGRPQATRLASGCTRSTMTWAPCVWT